MATMVPLFEFLERTTGVQHRASEIYKDGLAKSHPNITHMHVEMIQSTVLMRCSPV